MQKPRHGGAFVFGGPGMPKPGIGGETALCEDTTGRRAQALAAKADTTFAVRKRDKTNRWSSRSDSVRTGFALKELDQAQLAHHGRNLIAGRQARLQGQDFHGHIFLADSLDIAEEIVELRLVIGVAIGG